jgi:NAD(P)-dependent dehydrogenase (short-subunit alcohol dehydrogenase family)
VGDRRNVSHGQSGGAARGRAPSAPAADRYLAGKVAALEFSGRNIPVNSISPGAVDTAMVRRALRDFGQSRREAARDYPVGRITTAEEMARSVMWLSSDNATAVTGEQRRRDRRLPGQVIPGGA